MHDRCLCGMFSEGWMAGLFFLISIGLADCSLEPTPVTFEKEEEEVRVIPSSRQTFYYATSKRYLNVRAAGGYVKVRVSSGKARMHLGLTIPPLLSSPPPT